MPKSKIRVVVRKRPLNRKELEGEDKDILVQRSTHTLVVREERVKLDLSKYIEEHHFTFDEVFNESIQNEEFYQRTVQPLVQAAFEGTKVSCFAYGQTGSGKTFTMMGQGEVPGIYLLAAQDLFYLRDQYYQKAQIYVSFYEIYCSRLFDLLNDRNEVYVRSDAKQNVNIVGLQRKVTTSAVNLLDIMQIALQQRTVGQTGANDESSRSHGVLEIYIRESNRFKGKMNFIDLAGSERGADVNNSNKQTRVDSSEINKSLLALKECIRSLDQNAKHKPFRGSKLTQVLKDSFIGKCQTIMIANLSPSFSSCEHTLNTLRYADRVKELRQGAKKGQNVMMLPRQQSNVIRYNAKQSVQLETSKEEVHYNVRSTSNLLQPTNANIINQPIKQEEFINEHRRTIDQLVEVIKRQMSLLSQVDMPGSNVEQYVQELDQVLEFKENLIENLRKKLRFGIVKPIDVFDLSAHDDELLTNSIF